MLVTASYPSASTTATSSFAADVHLRPFQSVLNATACLIVRKRKSDSISATVQTTFTAVLPAYPLPPANTLQTPVFLCTNVCTTWLRHISLWCVSQCRLIVLVYQLPTVIYWSCASELQAMVHAVLLFLAVNAGMVCRWRWNCHHCQYDSSAASSRQFFFAMQPS